MLFSVFVSFFFVSACVSWLCKRKIQETRITISISYSPSGSKAAAAAVSETLFSFNLFAAKQVQQKQHKNNKTSEKRVIVNSN